MDHRHWGTSRLDSYTIAPHPTPLQFGTQQTSKACSSNHGYWYWPSNSWFGWQIGGRQTVPGNKLHIKYILPEVSFVMYWMQLPAETKKIREFVDAKNDERVCSRIVNIKKKMCILQLSNMVSASISNKQQKRRIKPNPCLTFATLTTTSPFRVLVNQKGI